MKETSVTEIFKKRGQKTNINVHEFESVELEIFKASEIVPKPQPWLWDGIIPLDTCTLFAGEGGIGKSQLLIDICAKISTGEKFQVGGFDYQMSQGSIIVLTAEDDFEYSVTPKLIAANANCDNIYIMRCTQGKISKKKKFIELDNQLELLEKKIEELGNVKLLIIDPISYFVGKIRDHINTEVVNFLGNLNEFAKNHNIAIILNKHLRKRASGINLANAIDEVGGAGAWVNSPRQAWLICRDQEDETKILFANLKVNITKKKTNAFSFKVLSHTIQVENGSFLPTTRLEWSQTMEEINADQALNKDTYHTSKVQIAITFILDYLKKNGQTRLTELQEMAEKKSIKLKTFRNAAEEIEKKYTDEVSISRGIKNSKIYMLTND